MPKIDSKVHPNDGKRLYILREHLDISQKALGIVLGCSERTIRNREKGLTEISQKDRRKLWAMTGVDVAPPDAANDPYEIVKRCRVAAGAENIPPELAELRSKFSIRTSIYKFRAKQIYRSRFLLSPLRRHYESFIDCGYYSSTIMLVIEQTKRSMFGGWEQHHALHDMVLFASAVLTVVFFVGTFSTIPWGVRQDEEQSSNA